MNSCYRVIHNIYIYTMLSGHPHIFTYIYIYIYVIIVYIICYPGHPHMFTYVYIYILSYRVTHTYTHIYIDTLNPTTLPLPSQQQQPAVAAVMAEWKRCGV